MAEPLHGSKVTGLSRSAKAVDSQSIIKTKADATEALRQAPPNINSKTALTALQGVIGEPGVALGPKVAKALAFTKSGAFSKTPPDVKQTQNMLQTAIVGLMLSARTTGDLEHVVEGLKNLIAKMPADTQYSLTTLLENLEKPGSGHVPPPPAKYRVATMLFHLMDAYKPRYSAVHDSCASQPLAPPVVTNITNPSGEEVGFNGDIVVLRGNATTRDDQIIVSNGAQSGGILTVPKAVFTRVLVDGGFSPSDIDKLCDQVKAGSKDAVQVPGDMFIEMKPAPPTPQEPTVVGPSATAVDGQVFQLDPVGGSTKGTENDAQILIGSARRTIVVDKEVFRDYLISERGCAPKDVDELCALFKKGTRESVLVSIQDMDAIQSAQQEHASPGSGAARSPQVQTASTTSVDPSSGATASASQPDLGSAEGRIAYLDELVSSSATTAVMFAQPYPSGRQYSAADNAGDWLSNPVNIIIMVEALSYDARDGQTYSDKGAKLMNALMQKDYKSAKKLARLHTLTCHPDRAGGLEGDAEGARAATFSLVSDALTKLTSLASDEEGAQRVFESKFVDSGAFQSSCEPLRQAEKPMTWSDFAQSSVVAPLDGTKRTKDLKDTPFSERRISYFDGDKGWTNDRGFGSLQNLEFVARAVSYQSDGGSLANDTRAKSIGEIFEAVSLAANEGRSAVAFNSLRLKVEDSIKARLAEMGQKEAFETSGKSLDVFIRESGTSDAVVSNLLDARRFIFLLEQEPTKRDVFISAFNLNP